jgi:hypothetical protein
MPDYLTPQEQGSEAGGPAAPEAPPVQPSPGPDPRGMVAAPAIALLVVAILSAVCFVGFSVLALIGFTVGEANIQGGPQERMLAGAVGVGMYLFAALLSAVIAVGANKMRQLQSYPFSMAAAVMAVIPFVSPCCLLGIPFGIWALVVLAKPEVKDAFR